MNDSGNIKSVPTEETGEPLTWTNLTKPKLLPTFRLQSLVPIQPRYVWSTFLNLIQEYFPRKKVITDTVTQQEKGLFKFIWGFRNMMRNDFSYYGAYTSNSQAIYGYYGPGTCTEESKKQCYHFQ